MSLNLVHCVKILNKQISTSFAMEEIGDNIYRTPFSTVMTSLRPLLGGGQLRPLYETPFSMEEVCPWPISEKALVSL
jgi:hypothetical protein